MHPGAGKPSGKLQHRLRGGQLDGLVASLASQLFNTLTGQLFQGGLSLELELVMPSPFGEIFAMSPVIQETLGVELIKDR